MNRYFEFSGKQMGLLIILAGLLLVGSVLQFVKGYATTDNEPFKFSVQLGDGNQTYAPIIQVDLNISPADSLELIPGIGPVFASRIISYRDSVGRFEKPDDLLKIPGIGHKTYEKIKQYIKVRPW